MACCRPATQFCCGCSLAWGVRLILFFHFLVCAFFIVEVFGVTFAPGQTWAMTRDVGLDFFWAAYSLAGLPLILLGAWGLETKNEAFVRLYLLYLAATIAVNLFFTVKAYSFSKPCADLPGILASQGPAFACGVVRGGSVSLVLLNAGIAGYLLFLVWSHCEDMANGGHPEFSDILIDEDARDARRRRMDILKGIIHAGSSTTNFTGLQYVPVGYGAVYESATTAGLGGSSSLFGGGKHEMRYPPPKGAPARGGIFS